MTTNNACPPESMLHDLVFDRLAAEVSDRLTDHIGGCAFCQERLAAESLPNLASELPKLKHKESDSSQLRAAVQRAKSLRDSPLVVNPRAIEGNDRESQADLTAFTRDGYELLGTIGQGGMGIVYKAREQSLDRVVAVKVLSPLLASDASSRERFFREARSAAAVVHPNVITIHAVSDKPPRPYIVMEFVEGLSLQQQLDSGAGISIENVVRIGRQIAAGLSAAHDKGVMHRDIKPANILLNVRTGKVLLGDFGLARAADHSRLTRTGTLVGTPAYVAPEALENPESADQRADLFSLGVVLYAMCSGDSPFQADSLLGTLQRLSAGQPEPLAQKVADVPVWLSDIVMRLLEKEPADRFRSAAEVREALGRGLKPQDSTPQVASAVIPLDAQSVPFIAVNTTRTSSTRTAKRRSGRRSHRVWIVAGLVITALLLGTLGQVLTGPKGSGDTVTQLGANQRESSSLNQSAVLEREAASSSMRPRVISESEDESTPFICMTATGRPTASFASLQEAIEHAHGGHIEIRTSGVIESGQCSILGSVITIAAGQGYEPVLEVEPDDENELEAMFQVEGELTLRGLQLRLPASIDDDELTLIRVDPTGRIRLVDCNLVVERAGCCVFSQSDVTMDNCHLHALQSTAIELDPQREARTSLRNCWVSGETAFELYRDQSNDVTILDCTFACEEVFSTYADDQERCGWLSIDSRRSLYLCGEALIVVEENGAEQFDPQIEWIGAENAFAGNPFSTRDEEDFDEDGSPADSRVWLQRIRSTGSIVENPFNIDIDELADQISDVDFRLSELDKSATVSAGANNDR